MSQLANCSWLPELARIVLNFELKEMSIIQEYCT